MLYTKLYHFISDELLSTLTRGEILVLIYILRRTVGFHKRRDAIPLRQFVHGIVTRDGRRLDSGTGLSRRQVINCLASLEAKGIIVITRSKSHLDEPGCYDANVYEIVGVEDSATDNTRVVQSASPYQKKHSKVNGISYKGLDQETKSTLDRVLNC